MGARNVSAWTDATWLAVTVAAIVLAVKGRWSKGGNGWDAAMDVSGSRNASTSGCKACRSGSLYSVGPGGGVGGELGIPRCWMMVAPDEWLLSRRAGEMVLDKTSNQWGAKISGGRLDVKSVESLRAPQCIGTTVVGCRSSYGVVTPCDRPRENPP